MRFDPHTAFQVAHRAGSFRHFRTSKRNSASGLRQRHIVNGRLTVSRKLSCYRQSESLRAAQIPGEVSSVSALARLGRAVAFRVIQDIAVIGVFQDIGVIGVIRDIAVIGVIVVTRPVLCHRGCV